MYISSSGNLEKGTFEAVMSQTPQKKPSSSSDIRIIRGKAGKKRKANHGDKENEVQETTVELATTDVDEAMAYLTTVMDDMLYRADS